MVEGYPHLLFAAAVFFGGAGCAVANRSANVSESESDADVHGVGRGLTVPDGKSPEDIDDAVEAWEDGGPIPPGYIEESSYLKALVITGGAVFGGLYVTGVVLGAQEADNGRPAALWSFVPVAGPVVAAFQPDVEIAAIGFLISAGGQFVGLVLTTVGLLVKRPVLVERKEDVAKAPLGVSVRPWLGPSVQGGLLEVSF